MAVTTFFATAQSDTKVLVSFQAPMLVNGALVSASNYSVVKIDGTSITIEEVRLAGQENRHVELILDGSLVSGHAYSVLVEAAVQTSDGFGVYPDSSVLTWVPRTGPVILDVEDFSGEVSSGLLGVPAGQVFFSPAFEVAVANSVIQVDSISLCTRAYDVYTLPSLPDPPILFTWPPPSGVAASSFLNGDGRLAATAARLGQAEVVINDLRADALSAVDDGPCDAVLSETIDITKASFLNDSRWRTFPATGASLGSFITASNLTPIGPGPVQNINLQP